MPFYTIIQTHQRCSPKSTTCQLDAHQFSLTSSLAIAVMIDPQTASPLRRSGTIHKKTNTTYLTQWKHNYSILGNCPSCMVANNPRNLHTFQFYFEGRWVHPRQEVRIGNKWIRCIWGQDTLSPHGKMEWTFMLIYIYDTPGDTWRCLIPVRIEEDSKVGGTSAVDNSPRGLDMGVQHRFAPMNEFLQIFRYICRIPCLRYPDIIEWINVIQIWWKGITVGVVDLIKKNLALLYGGRTVWVR